jgi:hypothetical protein
MGELRDTLTNPGDNPRKLMPKRRRERGEKLVVAATVSLQIGSTCRSTMYGNDNLARTRISGFNFFNP